MTSERNTAEWDRSIALLDRLPTLPVEERIDAVEQLFRSSSPMVRERALRTGAVVIPDERIEAYLRSDADDVARNAGLEMLKLRGARGVALAIRLLRDDDPDVVLQAVLALGHTRDLRALEPLRGVLGHADPNVVQAAIEAVGRLGDARAVPDLVPFLSADPWLQMAATQALGDLRDRSALVHLLGLLTDFFCGPLAAESVARIGGPKAFAMLADHLVRFGDSAEGEGLLTLLAHVVEGLRRPPKRPVALDQALRQALAGSDLEPGAAESGAVAAQAAARCLLALGPSESDAEAIEVLAGTGADALHLPTCLERRSDLAARLLGMHGVARCWGLLLVDRHQDESLVAPVAAALGDAALSPDLVKVATKLLQKLQRPLLAAGLVQRYGGASATDRRVLVGLVATQGHHLLATLAAAEGLVADDRLVLAARAGLASEETAVAIEALPVERRRAVLDQLADVPELTRGLPWARWLAEDPEGWSDLAAFVAGQLGLRELLPLLRGRLLESPTPALLRAVGDLGDRDSLPALAALLHRNDSRVVPLALETIGRIGGPEARRLLRASLAAHGPEERMAYRALSVCAAPDDDEIFRAAANHADWYVRLACAEVLSRYSRPENMVALAQLASDPVPLVAQSALASLEP